MEPMWRRLLEAADRAQNDGADAVAILAIELVLEALDAAADESLVLAD